MLPSSDRRIDIMEQGRSGSVVYHEKEGSLRFHWEFGGSDVVAIVQAGDEANWRDQRWALGRRAEILRFVADEVIRQRAPTCIAEIDVESGVIQLRQVGTVAGGKAGHHVPQARAGKFVRRYSTLKAMLGIGALVVVLIIGGVLWLGKKVLMVAPASGVPLNECVRTENHIATFIQYTDPHLPEITGRGGNTTTSISILLIPLDGSEPRLIPVVGELDGHGYDLSRIMGSDGRTLWFDCTGLFGVRLNDYTLITPKDLREANPSLDPGWWDDPRGMDIVDGKLHIINADRSAALDVDPATWKAAAVAPKPSNARFERHEPTDHLAAGFITSEGTWFGMHAQEELEGEFNVKSWIDKVESAEDAKRRRRFCTAELEPSSEGDHFRILRIAPINETEYLNAAFLRMDDRSEPLHLFDPDGTLMIFTSDPGLKGTLVVARVDTNGNIIWKVDTGIDRSKLSQILPGKDSFAFVGTRPMVPDKLSEPLVVVVENSTGTVAAFSLWQ